MESFSPFTRRVVALGILILLVLGLLNLAILIVGSATDSVSQLQDARFRQARLVALKARPLPSIGQRVPADMIFTAPDRDAAGQLVLGVVNAAATSAQLPLENVALAPADPLAPQSVVVTLAATGPEEAVLGFVNELEKNKPAVRLRTWRIARTDGQPAALHIEARALAVWSTGS